MRVVTRLGVDVADWANLVGMAAGSWCLRLGKICQSRVVKAVVGSLLWTATAAVGDSWCCCCCCCSVTCLGCQIVPSVKNCLLTECWETLPVGRNSVVCFTTSTGQMLAMLWQAHNHFSLSDRKKEIYQVNGSRLKTQSWSQSKASPRLNEGLLS